MDRTWSALILTGGTSFRFGSDKSEAIFDGTTLIDFLIAAIPTDIPIVIVGPNRDNFSPAIQVIQEDPPGGGPAAGVAAGLPLVGSEYVAVLATDMPFSSDLVRLLLRNLSDEVDGVIVVDEEGFQQPFSGIYRTSTLAGVLGKIQPLTNRSMRSILTELNLIEVRLKADKSHLLLDIDTQMDLIKAQSAISVRASEIEESDNQ